MVWTKSQHSYLALEISHFFLHLGIDQTRELMTPTLEMHALYLCPQTWGRLVAQVRGRPTSGSTQHAMLE